jgi:predicted phosphohydrolase
VGSGALGLLAALLIGGVPAGTAQSIPLVDSAALSRETIALVAGDIGDCDTDSDEATAALLDSLPGTVLTVGDHAYPWGAAADFRNCYEPTWGRHKARTRPSPGNHEYDAAGAAAYFAYFGPSAGPTGRGYYSFDLGEWHVVSLNSNVAVEAGSEQGRWLRADLSAHRSQCTLAYWHHPLFSSGDHGNNPRLLDVWRILYEFGVDVVANGHDHDYERFGRQTPGAVADPVRGIREFVVGTGGTALRPFATVQANSRARESAVHGVLKLTLRAQDYDWEFVPVAGESFWDGGQGFCSDAVTSDVAT